MRMNERGVGGQGRARWRREDSRELAEIASGALERTSTPEGLAAPLKRLGMRPNGAPHTQGGPHLSRVAPRGGSAARLSPGAPQSRAERGSSTRQLCLARWTAAARGRRAFPRGPLGMRRGGQITRCRTCSMGSPQFTPSSTASGAAGRLPSLHISQLVLPQLFMNVHLEHAHRLSPLMLVGRSLGVQLPQCAGLAWGLTGRCQRLRAKFLAQNFLANDRAARLCPVAQCSPRLQTFALASSHGSLEHCPRPAGVSKASPASDRRPACALWHERREGRPSGCGRPPGRWHAELQAVPPHPPQAPRGPSPWRQRRQPRCS